MNRTILIAAAVAGLATTVAEAVPSITLIPSYVHTRSADGTTIIPGVNLQTGANNDPSYRHRFDVLLRLDGAVSGEDFRGVTFNVSMGSGLSKAAPNWVSANGVFELDPDNNPGDFSTFFTANADGGANTTDLQAILVQNTDAVVADSRQYGETPRPEYGSADTLGYPTRLGRFEVLWDGTGPTDLTFTFTGAAGSVFIGNSNGAGSELTEGVLTSGDTFTFGSEIPEPSSLALLVFGGLSLIRRRA